MTNKINNILNIKDALAILNIQSTSNITFDEIKLAYRKAAAKYHPDHNPAGLEMMQMVNVAYDILNNQDIGKITNTTPDNNYNYGEIINKALNEIIGLIGLTIEVCGSWVWVGGNTKEHRENLKNAGFFWSPKKLLWYFRPETHKSHNHKTWDMNKIRATYGHTTINSNEQKQLQA